MSLNYYLPGDMTNGDVREADEGVYESMYNICVMMMATGVQKLDDKEMWLSRVYAMALVEGYDFDRRKQSMEFYSRAFDVLEGMTTNVSVKTPKEFEKHIGQIVREAGVRWARKFETEEAYA